MPTIIWMGPIFYDGQTRVGRVVRVDNLEFCFEVEHGKDAMDTICWKRCNEPFFEFIRAAGNLMFAIKSTDSISKG